MADENPREEPMSTDSSTDSDDGSVVTVVTSAVETLAIAVPEARTNSETLQEMMDDVERAGYLNDPIPVPLSPPTATPFARPRTPITSRLISLANPTNHVQPDVDHRRSPGDSSPRARVDVLLNARRKQEKRDAAEKRTREEKLRRDRARKAKIAASAARARKLHSEPLIPKPLPSSAARSPILAKTPPHTSTRSGNPRFHARTPPRDTARAGNPPVRALTPTRGKYRIRIPPPSRSPTPPLLYRYQQRARLDLLSRVSRDFRRPNPVPLMRTRMSPVPSHFPALYSALLRREYEEARSARQAAAEAHRRNPNHPAPPPAPTLSPTSPMPKSYIYRMPDGTPICFICHRAGHKHRDCPDRGPNDPHPPRHK